MNETPLPAGRLILPGFEIDLARAELRTAEGAHVELRPRSFAVLRLLIENAGRLVHKDEIMDAVWDDAIVTEDSLTQCIADIRHALRDSERRLVRTVPRRGYSFAGTVAHVGAPPAAAEAPSAESGPALPDRPSIAVLPFSNFSDDASQDYFCDGMTEDIITELARFSELFVIARNSSFQYKGKSVDVRQVGRELGVRYVLEGSVRRNAHRVRITAQLVDAASGIHRWAERYDRDIEDIFAVQDELTWTIASLLASHVSLAERERTATKSPATWQAYDYYLKAGEAFALFSPSRGKHHLYEARRLLDQSLALDPNFARAYRRLATTYVVAWFLPIDDDLLKPATIERAYELARKALQIEPASPYAHADLGDILTWRRNLDEAVAAFEKAIALNPNFSDWRFLLTLVLAGDAERAIRVGEAHKRVDPFYPPPLTAFSGPAHYMLKDYTEAAKRLREHLSRRPNNRAAHVWLAATCARLGRLKEARDEVAAVLRLLPSYTIDGATRVLIPFKYSEHAEHLYEGLRIAGIPER